MRTIVEVCANSVQDCIAAKKAGADRIELNNAVHMGGLTPSLGTLVLAKKETNLPIIAMVRARAGGFHYNDTEIETMFLDAKYLLENGADGLAFGFLTEDSKVDYELTKRFVDLCHQYQAEAVFHRAFDQTVDPFNAIETLIDLKVDRILTSGQRSTAIEGVELLYELNSRYRKDIELCLGSGINDSNVKELVKKTQVNQVHASFKDWKNDPTTVSEFVDYSYHKAGDYEISSVDKISKVVSILNE